MTHAEHTPHDDEGPDADRHDGAGQPGGQPGKRRGAPRGGRGGLVTRVAGDALHVRRVFGEPVRGEGVTLVPVASVIGGSGSGWGSGELGGGGDAGARTSARGDGSGAGGGGGFGVRVRPLGVYVVRGTDVEWKPAMDLVRVIAGGQLVGAIAVLALAWALRGRRRRR
jgi:uncharacterized spore protein YtfJ